MSFVAKLNPLLRSLASHLPAQSGLRRKLSGWWNAYLHKQGSDVTVQLHGETLLLRPHWRSLDPQYERAALGSFQRAIQPGDRVWDVGSHIGLYTLLAAKRVGPKGSVVAWEPAPQTFAELQHHLKINRQTARCRTINELIADSAREGIEFAIDGHASDSSTNRIHTRVLEGTGRSVVKLRSNTLDHWAQTLGYAPDVLKMDIEGAELFAFAGAKRLFSGNFGKQPKVLLSAHPASIWQYGGKVADLDREIAALGYRRLALDGRPAVIDDFAEYWLIPEKEADAFATRLREWNG